MPDMKLKPVAQQVVVVMGASRGIGRATAARFAREGAKVVVAARGEPGLRSLVEEIRTDGGEAVAEVADVTDPDPMQRVAQRAVTEYGRLDTWGSVSGVLLVAPFERTTPEEFARVVDVNLMGQVHGAMAALPYLKRDGGSTHPHLVDGRRTRRGPAERLLRRQARCRRLPRRAPDGGAPREAAGEPPKHQPGDDQHAAVRPGWDEDRVQAGRPAADLPAGRR